MRTKWTKDEEFFLKNNYSDKGLEYCLEKLNRTKNAISNKCFKLKLTIKKDIKHHMLVQIKLYLQYQKSMLIIFI